MSCTTIRFVGGPWHNRIECIELAPQVVVRAVQPKTTLSYAGCFAKADIRLDHYYLAKYHTNWGTDYLQYVHSSLVNGDRAAPVTHHERFKVWRIDRRQLEARLRRAMGHGRS